MNLLAKDFEQQTGIDVKVRNGEGPARAAQFVAEGANTPADVYFTENSPELMLLEEKGLLGKVDVATLTVIPAHFNSPTGQWVGVTARESVLAYNTGKIQRRRNYRLRCSISPGRNGRARSVSRQAMRTFCRS